MDHEKHSCLPENRTARDGRLIRIVGDEKAEYVPLMKQDVADKQYDIIVDDAPTSPNEKERSWQIIMQMLPMLKDMMTPDVALELLRYSPLPASLVEKWSKKAQEAAQNAPPPPPSPEELKAKAEQEKHGMAMQAKAADMQMDQQRNAIEMEKSGIELMVEQRKADIEMQMAQQKATIDMIMLAQKARAQQMAQQNANSRRTSSAK